MSIYTKTGDSGTTALFGGHRVKKYALRVEAYGTIDELNAAVSVAAKFVSGRENAEALEAVQYQLFYFGAEVASDAQDIAQSNYQTIQNQDISALEQNIDRCMSAVPKIGGFVLPGQSRAAAFLHQARTIARRAERRLVQLSEEATVRPELLKYINRLSDALYAMARDEDRRSGQERLIAEVMRRYRLASKEAVGPKALDFQAVHALLEDAVREAMRIGVPAVVAVVDAHGNLINTYRMPNALLVSVELAPKKAYTAVAMKTATHKLAQATQPGGELYQIETSLHGQIVTFGGGYPLYAGGRIVGGLGISGGTVAEDMQIAEAALNAFNKG